MGTSLSRLVQMVATDVGDFRRVVATANGSVDGSSFIDTNRLSAMPSDSLNGANLTIISESPVANHLFETRITDFDGDTGLATLSPNLPSQAVTGSVAWITNLYSKGFWFSEYTDHINSAITKSYPTHLVPIEYDVPTTFSHLDPTIERPETMTRLSALYYWSDEDHAHEVPASPQGRTDLGGWTWDPASKVITINGEGLRGALDGMSIRLVGWGKSSLLVDMDDETSVDAEWIVERCHESLMLSKGDQRNLAQASMKRNLADMAFLKIVRFTPPGTIDVE